MEIKSLKTVRFSKLVEESGKPVPVTLWTAPEEDHDFARAMREERVLTVMQRNVGAKADYGLVGFYKEPLAAYLVFPKRLAHPAGTKVVGIRYEQLADATPKGPLHKPKPEKAAGIRMRETVPSRKEEPPEKPAEQSSEQRQHPQAKPKHPEPQPPLPEPELYHFKANAELTFRQVVPIDVEASTAKEAAQLVKEKLEQLQPDLAAATIKKRASAPKKV